MTALPSASGAANPPAPATSRATPGADHILRLTVLARTAAGAQFQWSPLPHRRLAKPRLATEAGKQYRPKRGTADLTSGQWEVLLDHIEGTGGALQVQDPAALGLKQYFYRIITLP